MRVIITGGGTGGHLFPGIALATALQQRISGCEVMFIGTKRHLDWETLSGYDFQKASISCMGLKGMGTFARFKSVAGLPAAVFEAAKLMRKFKPDLVFGVGGYVTGPVLLAAKLLGIPTCIHEQNSVPGLANRMISRFVRRVFVSIPGTVGLPEEKTIVTGNPVRAEILAAAEKEVEFPKELTLLVLGGSLGAHRINLLMLEVMECFQKNEVLPSIRLIHQTGLADEERVKGGYAAIGIEADVSAFFKDMAELYSRANLVVARAGATTLAELSVMGLPSLLIPYPYAADDHQAKNGYYYVEGGGAEMYREADLNAKILGAAIERLLKSPDKLQSMGRAMKRQGRPGATDLILNDCLKLVDSG